MSDIQPGADAPLADFVPMQDGRTRLLVRRGWEDAAEHLAYRNANTDPATGLANRRELMRMLNDRCAWTRRWAAAAPRTRW